MFAQPVDIDTSDAAGATLVDFPVARPSLALPPVFRGTGGVRGFPSSASLT